MKEEIFKKAVKEYNDIMEGMGREDLTIGTIFSVGTEGWNLRDLVAEVDYQYSTYREGFHMNCERLHSSIPAERLEAMRECKRLKNFIERYKGYVTYLHCVRYHCSKFDN